MSDARDTIAVDWLAGGGEMGRLIQSMDWSATPLGPVASWPQSLRTTVSLCLTSNFPMCIAWGPRHVMTYNDGYRPICGGKHPHSMGMDFSECWASAWPVIGAPFARALAGHASFIENQQMFLDRNGYLEETFFAFSFSPIRDETGGVGGVLNPCHETTARMLSERRTRALRDLAARTSKAKSVEEVLALSGQILRDYELDVPFALLYARDASGRQARLVARTGLEAGAGACPDTLDLEERTPSFWPLAEVFHSGSVVQVDDIGPRLGPPPYGPYPEPPRTALLLPVVPPGATQPVAVLVAGVSPRLPFDEAYSNFYELLTAGVTAAVANARAFEEERTRSEALAQIDRAKTVFFSNVSHEFRTPLTLILGPLDDALAETTDVRQRERLELLRRNALRLQKLVNTLLDFSRIEAGRVQASYEPTDLAAFTAELASVFRSAIEQAGMRLVVDCPPLAEPVHVDRDMYEKIVLNLLSNAFKFTLEGEIAVMLRDAGATVEVSIADSGSGIADEQLPHVFERFHRIEGVAARTHEGTGIGLAMVQELVKLHGGSVTVKSAAGHGSTFTVAIPKGTAHLPPEHVVAARQPATTAVSASPHLEEALRWLADDAATAPPGDSLPMPDTRRATDADAGRPRIVWADDNADMREYVGRLLSPRYDVEAVSNGEAALAAIRRQPPDLVLADVMMPRLDGFGLLRALRTDEQLCAIPVILLSARAGEESRVEGMQAGADGYLVKPFSARELIAGIDAHVSIARLRAQGEQALRESERNLTAANLRLSEASRRKDEFLAMLGHELRNPLGVITSAVHLMRTWGSHDPVLEKALGAAQRQAAHMTRLVEELLDVARITEGKVTLRRERVRLAQVIDAAVEAARPAIEASRHRLHCSLPTEPLGLTGDPVRLVQVVGNLLNNAAKYTPPGGEIHLTLERVGHEAVIRVRDTGQGMPAELLSSVFDLFVQGTRSVDRGQGGLGVGLTLARRLVEMHDGRILAASQGVGLGSEFTVTLPILHDQRSDDAPGRRDESSASTARRRILVVDDHPDGAEMLRLLLEHEGHDVDVAHDGAAALARATSSRPEFVILDIGMPDMDGHAVAHRLRQDPAMASVTLIALTGYGQDTDTRRSRDSGFDAHLVKPVNIEALRRILA